MRQFGLNLRSDLHGTGVRVTCVEPGMSGGTEFSLMRFTAIIRKPTPSTPACSRCGLATVYWAASQPPHVNVDTIELMPVAQSFAPFQVHRDHA